MSDEGLTYSLGDGDNDLHRRVFTDLDPADEEEQRRVDVLLEESTVHEPAEAGDESIVAPDTWDQARWDSERQPPKTVDEAKAALAARVADPEAPDEEGHLHAYDDLGQEDE